MRLLLGFMQRLKSNDMRVHLDSRQSCPYSGLLLMQRLLCLQADVTAVAHMTNAGGHHIAAAAQSEAVMAS